jgi:thiamine-phosphate pyrophosphorylase
LRSPHFDLYLVTDRTQTGGRDLLWILEQALQAGVGAVQLREKDLSGRELLILAEKAKKLCERYHAGLFINDRIDIALEVDAEGVQLGTSSLPIEAARRLIGKEKLIGVSTHSLSEAEAAEQAGADFILFGPIYLTPSKAVYGKPQGLDPLRNVVEKISLPVYAIGGINEENAAEVKETGISGVALISAVLGAVEPGVAARKILAAVRNPDG